MMSEDSMVNEKIIKQHFINRYNEENYHNLMKNLAVGVGYFDLDGNILFFNHTAAKNMAGSPEDFIGKSIYELFGQENGKIYHDRILKTCKSETSLEFEDKVPLPGGVFWFISKYSKIKDDHGNITGVQIISTDITKSKEAELQLILAKNEAERYLDLAGNMILTLDRDGNITLINQKGLKLLGYAKNELMGKNWFTTCVPEDNRQNIQTVFSDIIHGKLEQLDHHENEIITKTGDIKLIAWYNTILRDENDQVISTLSSGLDITEKKHADDLLYEQKTLLDSIIDQSPIPVWISDHKGLLIRCNQALLDTLNVKEQDILKTYNVFNDKNLEDQGFLPTIKKVFENGTSAKISVFWEKSKGGIQKISQNKHLYLEATLFPIYNKNNKIQYVVCQWIDITEQHKIENKVRESEARYRALYENAPQSYQSLDPNGNILDVNPAWLKTLGYELSEVLGKPFKNFLHPQWQSHFEKNFPIFKEKGCIHGVEFEMQHKTGYNIHVRFEGRIGYDDKGKVSHTYCVFQDITQQVKALDALKESEEKYRLLTNNSIDVIWQMDLKLKFTYISPSVYKTFGYTPEEWIGTYLHQHASKKEFLKMSAQAMKGIKNYKNFDHVTFEAIMYDKEKNELPVEIIGRLLLNEKGLPIGLQGSTRDIRERKQTEEKLRESEEKYRNYIDNAPNGVFVVDLKGNYISVNKAGADMAGYTQKELLEMNVRDLSNDKGNSQAFMELLQTGHIAKQLSHIKKDGTIAWWYLNAVKLNNDKVIGFTIDITDKVKAEAELQKSEHNLSTLFKNMNEGFALHEIVKDKNGKPIDYIYLDINPAFEKMTGLKKSKTIGKKVTDILPEIKNDPVNWIERYCEIAQENKTMRFEDYSSPLKKWFMVSAFSPQKDQFATTIHDITERKKAENELIKLKNELEEKVQLQTKDLKEKIMTLERFHNATINREFRIKELRDEIKKLKALHT